MSMSPATPGALELGSRLDIPTNGAPYFSLRIYGSGSYHIWPIPNVPEVTICCSERQLGLGHYRAVSDNCG